MQKKMSWCLGLAVTVAMLSAWPSAQTNLPKEEFNATAIVNNNLSSGMGRVIMNIDRWSSEAEAGRLVKTLMQNGPDKLLDELRDMRSVGTIRTPDSLGYDLRYAYQEPGEDGGRRIVIATDRPIGFWEARNQPRTIDYPFTVIQMEIGRDGKGKGTMSWATKIRARGNVIELENFASAPIMLTEVESKRRG
jgi:hypothetical protein